MIELLDGVHEIIAYHEFTSINLYKNTTKDSYPQHWHSALEIIMPLKNCYTVVCSNNCYTIKEQEILIIAPGCLHSMPGKEEGVRLIFQFDFNLIHQLKDMSAILSLFSPAIHITPETSSELYEQLHSLILSIYNEYSSHLPLTEALIYSDFIKILVLIGRTCTAASKTDKDPKQQTYINHFLEICSYINLHCTENISLDEIACYAGFSKFHFSRLFKQFTNTTYYKYLNQKRIMYAQTLLVNPELSVTEVAYQSGYTSLSAFIRMFRICQGCTPSEYRNMYKV